MAKAKRKSTPRERGPRTDAISFRLPRTVVQQLDQVAEISGVNRSMVTRVLLGLSIAQGRRSLDMGSK